MKCSAAAWMTLVAMACAAPAPQGEPVRAIGEIAGEWDIVSFDGHRPQRLDPDGQRHAFVDISGDSLAFAIQCNYSGMRGRIDEDGRLIALPGDSEQTAMGCGSEREQRDARFFAFFRNTPTVTRRGTNEIVLRSGATQLELQRAAARQRAQRPISIDEFDGGWSADIVYLQVAPGHLRNLIADLEGARAEFEFTDGRVHLRFDCETVAAPVRLASPGALQAGEVQRASAGACRMTQEDRDRVASLISGAIGAERIEPNMMQLSAGDVRAVLVMR